MVLTAEMLFIMVYLCQAHFYVIVIMQLRRRYLSHIWNILDIFYLLIALTYIVIYIYRHAVSGTQYKIATLNHCFETDKGTSAKK